MIKLFKGMIISAAVIAATSCGGSVSGDYSGSGTIEVTEVNVSPLLTARILEIKVDEGENVEKGALLVTLSSDETAADLASMQARLRAAKRSVDQAAATYREARSNLQRSRELFSSGALSKQKFDEADTRSDIAAASLSAARSQVREIEALIRKASSRYDETKLYAPISGTVLERNYEEGEVILPGAKVLTIGDLTKPEMIIYISAAKLSRVQPGDKAKVKVDGVSKLFEGQVTKIAQEAEFTPKNVQTADARSRLVYGVTISLPQKDGVFKPGLMADAEILPRKLEKETPEK